MLRGRKSRISPEVTANAKILPWKELDTAKQTGMEAHVNGVTEQGNKIKRCRLRYIDCRLWISLRQNRICILFLCHGLGAGACLLFHLYGHCSWSARGWGRVDIRTWIIS